MENYNKTLNVRYDEIKKAKELSGAVWDDETKTITLDSFAALTYTKVNFYKFSVLDTHVRGVINVSLSKLCCVAHKPSYEAFR